MTNIITRAKEYLVSMCPSPIAKQIIEGLLEENASLKQKLDEHKENLEEQKATYRMLKQMFDRAITRSITPPLQVVLNKQDEENFNKKGLTADIAMNLGYTREALVERNQELARENQALKDKIAKLEGRE